MASRRTSSAPIGRPARTSAILAAVLALSELSAAQGGSEPMRTPVQAASQSRTVIVLPEADFQGMQLVGTHSESANVLVTSEVDRGRRLYKVRHNGRTVTAAVPVVPEPGVPSRVAYDPATGSFFRLLSSVRIELRDYGKLPEVIQHVEGVGGKAYPQLGYAVVGLRHEHHPLRAVESLRRHPEVEAAEVRTERPRPRYWPKPLSAPAAP